MTNEHDSASAEATSLRAKDEVCPAQAGQSPRVITDAREMPVRVVGDSRSGKEDTSECRRSAGGDRSEERPVEVRAAVVAEKRGNARGAKGGRKVEVRKDTHREDKSATVPTADKQVEETLWQRCKAERGVWTENMLIALERGVKGNKWFSLIDKVALERTLGIGWEKVKSNAGACGVDGISVGHFDKDSDNRLLAVKEHLKEGRYQPKPIRRVYRNWAALKLDPWEYQRWGSCRAKRCEDGH